MDDFLDQILSSSPWSGENSNSRSSWDDCAPEAQTNGLLSEHMGVYDRDEISTSSRASITASGSILGNSGFGLDKGLYHAEIQQHHVSDHLLAPPLHDNGSHDSKLLLHGVIGSNATSGPLGVQLNASRSVAPSHVSAHLTESGSDYHASIVDSHSMQPLWHPTYTGLSALPSVTRHGEMQGFGLSGDFLESNPNMLEGRYLGDEKISQLENFTTSPEEHNKLQNPQFQTHHLRPPMTPAKNPSGLQPNQQSTPINASGCIGVVKPRVRARRGQATDPHSIAERLRREKIADRMKNLQELVPNSNKTDKASMLDEIIEYVKFLQLQVKVLSMSRLGAAGAVVPLITDAQSEGSASLLLSPSVGEQVDLSESPDNVAFEQEVVKLMESNVTTAMQYLQNKGLCLMPIALAAALSAGKSSSNAIPLDTKNIAMHVLSSTNGDLPISRNHLPSSSVEIAAREGAGRASNAEHSASNDCNGAAIKREESHNVRELKPKA